MITIAKAFGMNVVAYDPYPDNDGAKDVGYTYGFAHETTNKKTPLGVRCFYW